jgi:enterochelin esterase-like enzyme
MTPFGYRACMFGCVMLMPASSFAQQGIVLESRTMPSTILGEDVRHTVYLPPDYETSDRYYPIVYLLHGYSDDDTGWLQFGEVNRIADQAIAAGEIPPMIIVMPDGKVTWYINDSQNDVRWEDMFIDEFVPYIEAEYRVRQEKQFRGIAGLSMGGYGSLVLAMRHPDTFAAVAAFSSGVLTDAQLQETPQGDYDRYWAPLFGKVGLQGSARHTAQWRRYSVLELVKDTPADELKKVRYYIDCGDDDFLAIGNSTLHILMTEHEIPHEYRVRDGAHTWSYWRTGLPVGLKFIGESFHR